MKVRAISRCEICSLHVHIYARTRRIYIYMCIYIHMQCLLASNQYAYAYDGVALLSKVNMRRIFNAGSAYYYVGLLYVMCPHH